MKKKTKSILCIVFLVVGVYLLIAFTKNTFFLTETDNRLIIFFGAMFIFLSGITFGILFERSGSQVYLSNIADGTIVHLEKLYRRSHTFRGVEYVYIILIDQEDYPRTLVLDKEYLGKIYEKRGTELIHFQFD